MNTKTDHKLVAIVAVEPADRVQCSQPGCGHSVYARIHVVREGDELIVLGSSCHSTVPASAPQRQHIVLQTRRTDFFNGHRPPLAPIDKADTELLDGPSWKRPIFCGQKFRVRCVELSRVELAKCL